MRMGFLAGGILGAAAAIYLSRSKHPLVSIGKEMVQDRVGGMAQGFTDRVKNVQTENSQNSEKNDPIRSEEMGIASEIVENDPELKKQVDEILHQEYQ